MRLGRALAPIALAMLTCMLLERSVSAQPSAATARPETEVSQSGIIAAGPTGRTVVMTSGDLATLPAVRTPWSFQTGQGLRQASFEGPLLWTVLDHAGAIASGKPRELADQAVTITGRDGYKSVLAMGEIAPAFEGKRVIIAERMDGRALGPAHVRLVVPGDRFGARGVRDVVRIAVVAPERRRAGDAMTSRPDSQNKK